jgi:hypothetical protein
MKSTLAASAVAGALLVAGGSAQAQSFIHQAGAHRVALEIEVHGVIGGLWWGYFATGPGVRFGIPLARNPGSINNMPALSMGVDIIWFPDYFNNGGYTYISSPVVLQWNFYVHHRWSIAPEAGFALELYPDWNGYCGGHWGYYNAGFGHTACGFALWPDIAFTARYHFHDQAGFPALVMRLGWPSGFNIGVSF